MKDSLLSMFSSHPPVVSQPPGLVRIEYSRATVRPSDEAVLATFSQIESLVRRMWDRDVNADATWSHTYLPRPWRQELIRANPPQQLVLPRDLLDFGRAEYASIFRDAFKVDLPVMPDGALFWDGLPPHAEIIYMLQTLFPGMLQLVTADQEGRIYTHTVVNNSWLLYEAPLPWLRKVNGSVAEQAERRRLGLMQ